MTSATSDAAGSAVTSTRPSPDVLAETLARVDIAFEYRAVSFGQPRGEGWLAASDLLVDEGALLDERLAVIREREEDLADVAASYFMGWYAGAVAAPAIGGFVLDRRVPDLNATTLSLHADEDGWFDASAIAEPLFTHLPGDPATGAPGARMVSDVGSLRAVLVTRLLAHMSPVVAAVRSRAPLGLRALWGAVADSCASTFLQLAREGEAGARMRAEADAFLAAAAPPLRARPRWVLIDHGGTEHTYLERGACCLAYKTADHGYCTSCPFTSDEDRDQRLRTYLDEQAG